MKGFSPPVFPAIRDNSGFGLVELMVTLVFVAILGGLAIHFTLATENDAERQLRQGREGVMLLKSALNAYTFDLEKPAPTREEGGLHALIREGYLEEIPKDPWGNDYQYVNPPVYSVGRSYDLFSLGPDGKESDDDIVEWDLYGEVFRGAGRRSKKQQLVSPSILPGGNPQKTLVLDTHPDSAGASNESSPN